MEKFDNGGEANGAGTIFSCVGIGEKQQSGAQALAASTEEIAGDFADRLIGGGALAREFLFDEDQVVANQIKNFFNRQKRDGAFPWAGIAACVPVIVDLHLFCVKTILRNLAYSLVAAHEQPCIYQLRTARLAVLLSSQRDIRPGDMEKSPEIGRGCGGEFIRG